MRDAHLIRFTFLWSVSLFSDPFHFSLIRFTFVDPFRFSLIRFAFLIRYTAAHLLLADFPLLTPSSPIQSRHVQAQAQQQAPGLRVGREG